jgi:hypothetical protein
LANSEPTRCDSFEEEIERADSTADKKMDRSTGHLASAD